MRVQIIGDAPSARALRGHLSGFSHVAVVDAKADFTLTINELATGPATVDGVDGPLEFHVLNQLAEALGSVLVLRTDRNRSDGEVTVGIPREAAAEGERAIFRALTGKLSRVTAKAPWWRRRVALVALALALPGTVHAQVITPIKCHNGTTAFFCGDAANSALRVNVVAGGSGGGTVEQGAGAGAATNFWNFRLTDGTSFYKALTDTELRATPIQSKISDGTDTALVSGSGSLQVTCDNCGGASPFEDEDAFTIGTSSVSVIGFLADDVAPDSATENSAAAPRMSLNRNVYTQLRDGAGSERGAAVTAANALKVDGSAVTQPVSGTFWQATQPVSGTVTVTDGAGALNVIVDSSALPTGASTLAEQQTQTTALSVMDDWDETDRAKVNPIAGQAGVQGASGVVTALTQRVVLATDVPLPAGTNAIGKLAANPGVDIGDVDVLSVVPGTGATNEGKAEDAGHTTGDVGVAALGVRVDPTTTAVTSANTDYGNIAIDQYGAVPQAVHPGRYSCFVPLTATATTQCQAAPGAGLRNYVTSVVCSNGAATVQGVDIVYGTGAACVTGITAISHKFQMGTNQLTTSPFVVSVNFGPSTPLVPGTAAAICTRPTAATAYGCTITGFIAP